MFPIQLYYGLAANLNEYLITEIYRVKVKHCMLRQSTVNMLLTTDAKLGLSRKMNHTFQSDIVSCIFLLTWDMLSVWLREKNTQPVSCYVSVVYMCVEFSMFFSNVPCSFFPKRLIKSFDKPEFAVLTGKAV